jgi:hypothetical protein
VGGRSAATRGRRRCARTVLARGKAPQDVHCRMRTGTSLVNMARPGLASSLGSAGAAGDPRSAALSARARCEAQAANLAGHMADVARHSMATRPRWFIRRFPGTTLMPYATASIWRLEV